MLHRGQESTDGAGGGELTVPMAWLYAEYIADELLRTGDLMPILDQLGPAVPAGLTRYSSAAFGEGYRDNVILYARAV